LIDRLRRWLVPWLHRLPVVRAAGRRLLRGRTVRQPFHGGVICLDAIEHSWLWTGSIRAETWDDDIQDRLLERSRECRAMIDVGANIGLMSLAVALRNPGIAIVCVEPNVRAVALLRESVAANRLGDRITVLDAAAGIADGMVGFAEDASTTGHITADGALCTPSVDIVRLIEAAAQSGRCLVKIDVEGYETVLLTALPRVASLARVELALEVHATGFNGVGDPGACSAMLRASGATIAGLDGRAIAVIEPWTNEIDTMQIEARWPAADQRHPAP
jgi:FkbM family methyltransferase